MSKATDIYKQLSDSPKSCAVSLMQYGIDMEALLSASKAREAELQERLKEAEQRVKHSCWMQMQRPIHRYLMANAHGRRDGAQKAHYHIELCSILIAVFREETFFENELIIHPDFHAVHDATSALTSYMDEQIGFPLDSTPEYGALAPKFFDKFYALGVTAIVSQPAPVKTRKAVK